MEEIKSKPFPLRSFFRERYTPLRENSKLIARFLFAVLLFAVGAWLFTSAIRTWPDQRLCSRKLILWLDLNKRAIRLV